MKPFFSIIIPVYNVEPYIIRCLDSCINQTFKDIEIIVVDDCGEDNSIQIAKEYAQQDLRIKIIRTFCNMGPFHSRLFGCKNANGIYYLFIDGDDFLHLNTCMLLNKHIEMRQREGGGVTIDILGFEAKIYPPSPSKRLSNRQFLATYQTIFGDDIVKNVALKWEVWNKTYHSTLILKVVDFIEKNLMPLPKINIAEDALKFFLITLFAKSYEGMKEPLYFYCQNPQSITRNHSKLEDIKRRLGDYNTVINIFQSLKNYPTLYEHPHFLPTHSQIISLLKHHKKRWFFLYFTTYTKHFKQSSNYYKFLSYSLQYTKSKTQRTKIITKIIIYKFSFGLLRI